LVDTGAQPIESRAPARFGFSSRCDLLHFIE